MILCWRNASFSNPEYEAKVYAKLVDCLELDKKSAMNASLEVDLLFIGDQQLLSSFSCWKIRFELAGWLIVLLLRIK